ncbi:DUF1289 domain-containing protein [Halomonas sp. KX33721]|uniref:DUF1289 domain-containing protein n=1 Tax=Halomonas sp. KX33721 TaxID=1819251 RepID=UPI0007813FF1|nr:DUF1289 domain-containing protein [Halomonas sp. KX33721]
MPTSPRPLSPCIHVCQIDPSTQMCQGCGRTLDEIACWGSMTEAEKAPVWERIEQAGYVEQQNAARDATTG